MILSAKRCVKRHCAPNLHSSAIKLGNYVAILSLALLGFSYFERHAECVATLWQHQIDRVQKTVPRVPVGQRKPLQHHERMQVLGKERIADIVGQPLVKPAWPVPVPIPGAFAFQLFQEPRTEAFIDKVAGVIGHDAVAVLAHARPLPALEPVDVL